MTPQNTAQVPTRRTQGTSVPATTAAARKDVKSLIEGSAFRAEIAKVLPKHLTAERMIRVALTATMKTPKLLLCTADSLTRCLLDCSALGIEPDGRRAHLIPFEDRKKGAVIATLIIDYKGLAELAMRSGLVSNIHADVVRENDVFEYDLGEIKTHKIDFRNERGAAYAFYAICRFKDGTVKADVMSVDEVEAIRMRSKSPNEGPWATDPVEMGKKTVFRRLSKWLPLSPEFRDAVEKDDGDDEIKPLVNVTPRPPLFDVPATPAQVQGAPPDPEPQGDEHPPVEADNAGLNSPDPIRRADLQAVEDVKEANYAKIATKLDAERQLIGDGFTDAGVTFDLFRAWILAARKVTVSADGFAELEETIVRKLMPNLPALIK
jgi:recombination protein RecT